MMQDFFFGYGSLVNRTTHAYPGAQPARVTGWRRAWRHTDLRPVAYLTAEPAPGVTIDGLVAEVPGGDWVALDAREHAYLRHALPPATIRHSLGAGARVQIYAVPPAQAARASVRHPILASYLDVVVQGYLREFGLSGVADFFATTEGWDSPVLDDRAAPRYPRARHLEADERALVDSHLAALGVTVLRG